MSYAEEIKNRIFSGHSVSPVRVVIYARVSTDNEGQRDSCSNQVDLAKRFIQDHGNIVSTGVYVDDGISGKSDYNRPQYNAMLEKIEAGEVDLVITKSLSRLNRNQLNALMLTSVLVEHECTVLTLEDGQVHDFEDIGSDLIHSLSFAIDAQYVKRQSINGHKTQELRCERKELTAKDISFGYRWHKESKTISIDKGEAEAVTFIFEEYVYKSSTPAAIRKVLDSRDIHLSEKTISSILQDERYVGRFFINKRTSRLGTGKAKSRRIKLPKEEWVLVERPDLQVIDTELFDLAQKIRETRQTIYEKPEKGAMQARFQGSHLFAGKIFCAECGKPFHFGHADRKGTVPIYRIKSHGDCVSPMNRLYEEDIEQITRAALKAVVDRQEDACRALEKILVECVRASKGNADTAEKLKKQKAGKEKQIDCLIEALSEGGLADAARQRIKEKINGIENSIAELTASIKDTEAQTIGEDSIESRITAIRAAITELRSFTTITRERVLNYIDRIRVYSTGDMDMILKSGSTIRIPRIKPAEDYSKDNQPHEEGVGKMGRQGVRCSSPGACPAPLRRALRPRRSGPGSCGDWHGSGPKW